MKYQYAIVRPPGKSYKNAISSTDENHLIDIEKAKQQHAYYCSVLQKLGLTLISLPTDETYPDGCFVQDPCVAIGDNALITNQKASSRKGEGNAIEKIIKHFKKIKYMKSEGNMDGGDVLITPKKIFVGLSKRTNKNGISQLKKFLAKDISVIPVLVKNYLHLLTGITYLGKNTMIASELINKSLFNDFEIITVSQENEYAANCLTIDNTVVMPKGYKKIAKQIKNKGFEVIEVEMSEFKKADGGVTCLSLIF